MYSSFEEQKTFSSLPYNWENWNITYHVCFDGQVVIIHHEFSSVLKHVAYVRLTLIYYVKLDHLYPD